MITVVFLSCKRFNFFEETFTTFFKYCQDLDLITSIIIIDDNSNDKDRKNISHLSNIIPSSIPYMIIYRNGKKGLANSLNLAYDLCKTEYIFIVEDDWPFIREGHFIRIGIDSIKKHPKVKKFCIDFSSAGKSKIESQIYESFGEKYFIHEYEDKTQWPSYTFRQGISEIKAIRKTGYVNSKPLLSHDGTPPTLETDYAVRFCEKGYRTAFLLDTFVREASYGQASAFDLNDTSFELGRQKR